MWVRLTRRWVPPTRPRMAHDVGAEVEVSDGVGAWLVKSGAAVDLNAEPVTEPAPEVVSEEPEPAPEVEPDGSPDRPLNAAKKDVWETYYRAVTKKDPKGMDKNEIIAAVG